MSSISNERFGTSEGGSGWSWDKGGIGMGGKEAGINKTMTCIQLIISLINYVRIWNTQAQDDNCCVLQG